MAKTINYKNRYKKYSKEVQEQMNILIDNAEMEDAYVTILDLLAINYEMLFKSMESIRENGFDTQDVKKRSIKNHAIQTLNQSQMSIIKLLNSFPSSPLAKAKIKKLSELVDTDDNSPLDKFMKS